MRSEKLYDALTEVEEDLVEEARVEEARVEKVAPDQDPGKKKRSPRLRWLGAVAAVLALAILLTAVLRPSREGGLTAFAIETPTYPANAPYPDLTGLLSGGEVDEEALEAAYQAWNEGQKQRMEARRNYSPEELRGYLTAAIPAFLGGHAGENAACSPLNLYLALAMLAETTGGETQAQILELLGAEDLDRLRTLANSLFLANYRDDGAAKSLLAGAVWLREDLDYRADTLKRLAQTYYAASFRGEMGSPDYDAQLRDWLNQQTGNQLEDQIRGLSFHPDTVLALTTTVDFAAKWYQEFQPQDTEDGTFHGPEGDLDCRMMRQDLDGHYYWGRQFGATELQFTESAFMRFLLPDQGVTPEALLEDPEAVSFLLSTEYGSWENDKYLILHLSLPRFDVSSQLSLEDSLRRLGVTAAFDRGAADFSPLTQTPGVFLSEVKHGARVAVDEKGVTASAYTMMGAGAGEPPSDEMDLVLDRPFLFAIYAPDRLPLFVGIVNRP